MRPMQSVRVVVLLLSIVGAGTLFASETTKVVLLGTGTPNADPQHSGPAVAIIVDDVPYLVDFGPGVVRQAAAMSPSYGGSFQALEVENLDLAFLTHLHSDHTAGYPDLILTPWVLGRDRPLRVFGPKGIIEMTQHVLAAYREDIRYRVYGQEPASDTGWRVDAHEISEGVVYTDEKVTVEAFPVRHGTWPNAFGYRFTTPDRVIVISGDTAPSPKVAEFAAAADVLIHEVYSKAKYDLRPADWRSYHVAHHTSTVELGKIAAEAKVERLVLYHILAWGASDEELVGEIRRHYAGEIIVGRDLMVIE